MELLKNIDIFRTESHWNTTKSSEMSQVKRSRLKKQLRLETVKKMREMLPIYKIEQIREYQMPLFEANMINFEENGYNLSAKYIKELIDYQTKMRNESSIGSNIWMKPQLRYSLQEFQYLAKELMKAEDYRKQQDIKNECKTMLKLAIYFAFLNHDWWWLGEKLLLNAISISKYYNYNKGEYEALSRFAYGKFLIENAKEYESAIKQFIRIRELCEHACFTAKDIFPDVKHNLFQVVNDYLYLCNMRTAQSLVDSNPRKAIEKATTARRNALEACNPEGEAEALMLKGICQCRILAYHQAIKSLQRASNIFHRLGSNKKGLCKSMITLAEAYVGLFKWEKAEAVLVEATTMAETNDLPFYRAIIFKNLGECLLATGQLEKANKLFTLASTILDSIELDSEEAVAELYKVKTIEALSRAMELWSSFTDLIVNFTEVNEFGNSNLTTLLQWKNLREPFWQYGNEDCEKITSIVNSIRSNVTEQMMKKFEVKALHSVKPGSTKSIMASNKYNAILKEASSVLIGTEDRKSESDRNVLNKL